MYAINFIGCEPGESKGLEVEQKKGYATIKSKASLIPLKVVIPDGKLVPILTDSWQEATVYVAGDSTAHGWFKTEYQVGDKRFVLVPIASVLMVDYPGV